MRKYKKKDTLCYTAESLTMECLKCEKLSLCGLGGLIKDNEIYLYKKYNGGKNEKQNTKISNDIINLFNQIQTYYSDNFINVEKDAFGNHYNIEVNGVIYEFAIQTMAQNKFWFLKFSKEKLTEPYEYANIEDIALNKLSPRSILLQNVLKSLKQDIQTLKSNSVPLEIIEQESKKIYKK